MADRSAKLDFIMRLNDQITAPLAKVKMGFNDLAETGEKYIKQAGIGLAGMVGAGVAISKSLQPALEQNRALGEVKSLGVAQDALDALNRKSLAFSVAYGANARDFVASAYSIEGAIKGLTGSQLATFTNVSNVLAKATKTDAATMSAYVGTLYNLNKGAADAMGKGAWVERLGGQTALAVQLFRTSGAQIGEAFKAAGGLASTAGVDLAEQMAVLGTLSSTMEGGEAGGLYKSFFENVTGASEKLGMSFTDQQGRLLPMLDILEKLRGRFGDLSIEANGKALRDAFGGEASRLIATLMADTGRLTHGIDQLGRVRGLEHAAKMAKTMVDPWQQFLSVVQALRVVFGQVLIPLLTPLMERLVDIGNVLIRWTQLFPNIARVIGLVVLGVLGLTAGVAALTFIVALAKTAWLPFLFLQKIGLAGFIASEMAIMAFGLKMGLLATWSKVAAAGMWLFNAALWANPITWVVVGIIALGVAIAAAVVYWDEIVAAIMNTAAFQWVSQQLSALGAWFDSMGGWGGMARAAWDGIVGIFRSAIGSLIALLNKIPGINIETSVADLPDLPGASAAKAVQHASAPAPMPPAIAEALQASRQNLVAPVAPTVDSVPAITMPAPSVLPAAALQVPTPAVEPMPAITMPAPSILPAAALQVPTPAVEPMPAITMPPPSILPAALQVPMASTVEHAARPDISNIGVQLREAISASAPALAPQRASAVPRGGLLSSIQQNTQHKGMQVEKVEIHTGKAMSPLELENMLEMAAG